jgi:endonuclease/exonuclease/phosphatase family metal-dependent hydrolase
MLKGDMQTRGHDGAPATHAHVAAVPTNRRRPRRCLVDVQHLTAPQMLGADETLGVLTLNLAHGRGNRLIQRLVRRGRAELQLLRVSALLRWHQPYVVALQEADGKAIWSGRFNHVDFLARQAGYASYTQMHHVQRLGLAYGTALLARGELGDGRGGTFKPTPPTFRKGWVSAILPWPAAPDGAARVVSLHLDFLRARNRLAQLRELIVELSPERLPLIIMGDFNSTPRREPGMDELMTELKLHTYEQDDTTHTHPASRRRIDWILVSSHLRFVRHIVLPDVLSDHLPVLAELAPATGVAAGTPSQ